MFTSKRYIQVRVRTFTDVTRKRFTKNAAKLVGKIARMCETYFCILFYDIRYLWVGRTLYYSLAATKHVVSVESSSLILCGTFLCFCFTVMIN